MISSLAEWLGLVQRVHAAMLQVEALPEGASGALIFGERDRLSGTIFVEENRVCWIAAVGMGRRLADILRRHLRGEWSDADLEALYARCREDRVPIGEALVSGGLLSAEQLRDAMKQHTVASLLALHRGFPGDAPWPLHWVPRAQRGYSPRFTFSAAEVLAAVGAQLVDEAAAELISDHLQTLAATGGSLVAFTEADADPLLVGVQSSLWLSLQDVMDLASWASAALQASPGFSPMVAHRCAQTADGGTVAWTYEAQRCVAVCPDGESLRKLVASLDNSSLAMVLATRQSVLDRVRRRTTAADALLKTGG